MKKFKNQKCNIIFIIISIPILLIAQYYLFKFGILRPMVKGAEIQIVEGEYVKDIDKYVVKLNDTVTLSTGKYIKIPYYAKDANIWFNVLDDTGTLKIEGNKMIALKEGFSSIGIMKNSRVLKKATIKVVDPKVEKLQMNLCDDLEYVGDTSEIESSVEVDYKKFQDNYKITYESSDEDILKVKGDKIHATGVGTATLTAKAGNKKVKSTFKIDAWVSNIGINKDFEIEIGQRQNLDPTIKTSPRGLKHPNIKYDFVEKKLPVARAISIDEDGSIVGLREGYETIKITCGNKKKIVKVHVVEDSVTNNEVENLEYDYEIIDGKVVITLSWDFLNKVDEYEVYLRDNSVGEDKFSKIKTVYKDNNSDSGRIKTTIELELKDTENINIDLYVVGKTKVGKTKHSNIITIKTGNNSQDGISDTKVEGLSASVDRDNGLINVKWKEIDNYNCTYYLYVKNNSKDEKNFTLWKQGIQGNNCSISMPEGELDLDMYVVAKSNGNSSQKSRIINVR